MSAIHHHYKSSSADYWHQCVSVRSLGGHPALFGVSLPQHALSHTRESRYISSAEFDDGLIIWIRCAGAWKHLHHLQQVGLPGPGPKYADVNNQLGKSHSYESDISRVPTGDFSKLGTNVHLNSKLLTNAWIKWWRDDVLYPKGERSRSLWPHGSPSSITRKDWADKSFLVKVMVTLKTHVWPLLNKCLTG